jgi:hypothetical protein
VVAAFGAPGVHATSTLDRRVAGQCLQFGPTSESIVILSDRAPSPAAFAGWGGGAKDLLLPRQPHACLASFFEVRHYQTPIPLYHDNESVHLDFGLICARIRAGVPNRHEIEETPWLKIITRPKLNDAPRTASVKTRPRPLWRRCANSKPLQKSRQPAPTK